MSNYTFENLSPIEFEDLSRDLLQKTEKIIFESFSEGKDSGVDFRYSKNKRNDIIVQCKRYKDFKSLLSNLKKEFIKAKKLNPKRYILTTSASLSVKNKKEIIKLFNPYITNNKDILGREDLNNLLKKYPDIEESNFKLWLLSTNILNKILKSKICNQSNFEEGVIKRDVRIYVKNESYNEALRILEKNSFVIVSGIPGIGKTTLARMLVYHLLSKGFEEFIYLSKSIDEGYETYNDSKKQVFLFDDFLGRNFLEHNFKLNEEKQIINFIKKISISKNKILIFTTREYILNQAKSKYDLFEDEKIEIGKCVLDLSKYSKLIKAKILYHHLFFSNLPMGYVDNILDEKKYLEIINHNNYSPRIIELMTSENKQKEITSDNFFNKFIESLDNPEDIWKHAYENQILELSQFILIVILVSGTPILLNELESSVQNLSQKLNDKYGKYTKIVFNRAIKELENSFIGIYVNNGNDLLIDFQNPSIQDFLINYLSKNNSLIKDILKNTNVFDHLFKVFSLDKKDDKIYINQKLLEVIEKRILNDFDDLYLLNRGWVEISNINLHKIYIIFLFSHDHKKITNFIVERFKALLINDLNSSEKSKYIDILEIMGDEINLDGKKLIPQFVNKISSFEDVEDFMKIKDIYPEEYDNYIKNNDDYIKDRISDTVNDIDISPSNADETIKRIKSIEDYYDIELSDLKMDLEEMSKEYIQKIYDEDGMDYYEEERIEKAIDNDQIIEMFNSLKR